MILESSIYIHAKTYAHIYMWIWKGLDEISVTYISSDVMLYLSLLRYGCAHVCVLDAQAENIRTMKLPLREHVHLQGTSVLTVNHVVEIMLKFRSTNSWREAFNVLPGRKMVGNSDVASDEDDHTAAVAPEGVEHEGKEDSDL